MSEKSGAGENIRGVESYSYRRATGDAAGFFLSTLKESGTIAGAACAGCGQVSVPPRSYCDSCGSETACFTEVGPRGVVISWARVTGPGAETGGHAPVEPPFRYVLVRLAGADTDLLHVAPDDDRVKIGAAVTPVFREPDERTGSIADIRWFVPAEAETTRGPGGAGTGRAAPAVESVTDEVEIEYLRPRGSEHEELSPAGRVSGAVAGLKCAGCGAVLLPPGPRCGFCYTPLDEWIELPDTGVVVSHTVVRTSLEGQPAEPPYAYASIMLDGADVEISHLLGEVEVSEVGRGMRVKAVWAGRPTGSLNDVRYFRPEEGRRAEGTVNG